MKYTKEEEEYFYNFIYEICINNYELSDYNEHNFLFKIDKNKNKKSFNLCRDVKSVSGDFLRVKNYLSVSINNYFGNHPWGFTSYSKFYVVLDKDKVKESISRSEKSIILIDINNKEENINKKKRL